MDAWPPETHFENTLIDCYYSSYAGGISLDVVDSRHQGKTKTNNPRTPTRRVDMFRKMMQLTLAVGLLGLMAAPASSALDKGLDLEVWTKDDETDYYQGDELKLRFRANLDCYVAIFAIDNRGFVTMLFPTDKKKGNYVAGGEKYKLPDDDQEDLELNGPEGTVYVFAKASRLPFEVPDWYRNSGIVNEDEDVWKFARELDEYYFSGVEGQTFAYDRAIVFVNEWEPDYFRPIYSPVYHSHLIYGNAYIDHGWGHSVYIDGVFWGVTPLYLPRVPLGWRTVTIFGANGGVWEQDVYFDAYNTIVLDGVHVTLHIGHRSRFSIGFSVGYRDPIVAGYVGFHLRLDRMRAARARRVAVIAKVNTGGDTEPGRRDHRRKYVRGHTRVKKDARGLRADESSERMADRRLGRINAREKVVPRKAQSSTSVSRRGGVDPRPIDRATKVQRATPKPGVKAKPGNRANTKPVRKATKVQRAAPKPRVKAKPGNRANTKPVRKATKVRRAAPKPRVKAKPGNRANTKPVRKATKVQRATPKPKVKAKPVSRKGSKPAKKGRKR
jgi:hypothetical protein